ncbi:MAG: signal transduction histidine kinase [Halioglobus sp.]|jgi:signal transduction histidine kinase
MPGIDMRAPNWKFLRAYLVIASLVLLTGLALERVLEYYHVEGSSQENNTLTLGSFRYAQTLIPMLETQTVKEVESYLATELEQPASLHQLGDFSTLPQQYQQLQDLKIVTFYDEEDLPIVYRRLDNTDWVLALGPNEKAVGENARWIVPVFYTLLAFAVFVWIRPLSRDLSSLQRSAAAFGDQDFSNRVDIPGSSWLAPLGIAFNSMAQRIQSLMRSHQELTQAVSHELRTPLARIRFSLEMIDSEDSEQRKRHRQSIGNDVEELNTLIEEMLAYAELDQHNLIPKLEPLDLGTWLKSYVDNYASTRQNLSISLHSVESRDSILADSHLIKRSLDNLIGNAMRYANSAIAIQAEIVDGYCEIHVRDDGPGIPELERSAALQPYSRLQSPAGNPSPGFGLGLAIVQRAMQLHLGELAIGTASQGGADMCLRWPVEPSYERL